MKEGSTPPLDGEWRRITALPRIGAPSDLTLMLVAIVARQAASPVALAQHALAPGHSAHPLAPASGMFDGLSSLAPSDRRTGAANRPERPVNGLFTVTF